MLNLLRISISMGVPIVLLLLCGRWLNRRFRAELKYVLWLVISLRLMVPVSVSLPEGLAQVPVLQRAGTGKRRRGILVLAAVLTVAVLCGFTVASQEEADSAVQPSVLEEPSAEAPAVVETPAPEEPTRAPSHAPELLHL